MSSTTTSHTNIFYFAINVFIEKYPTLYDYLSYIKKSLEDGTIDIPTAISGIDEERKKVGIPDHTEAVHPKLPSDWKTMWNATYLNSVVTTTDKNDVYFTDTKNELNVIGMTEDEIWQNIINEKINLFFTFSVNAGMFFKNFGIKREDAGDILKTNYILEKTIFKDDKVVSYPYYKNTFIPPNPFYQKDSREFTNYFCGWISPYKGNTIKKFLVDFQNELKKSNNKLVVRVVV